MSMQSGCHALCQPKARAPYSCPNRKATDRLPLRVISPHCDTSTAFPAIASNDKFRHPKLSRGNQVELVCHDASLLGLEPSYSKFDVAFVSAAQGTAAAEFHSRPQRDIVWNCWTGALAHLGAARANALESRTKAEYAKLQSLRGNAADAAVVRAPNRFR